ncbi:MAG: membrane protein insertase YidC [Desulfovibrionaceae bacterium]|nr:membrane protein insertase YidC [Desulfovibrionaceae bacterium]
MEDKRTFIAVALSIIVFICWTPVAEYFGWISPAKIEQPVSQPEPSAPKTPVAASVETAVPPMPLYAPSEGREIHIDTPLFSATIHSGGGVIRSFTLNNFARETDRPDRVNLVDETTAAAAPAGLIVNGLPSWSKGKWHSDATDISLKPGETRTLTFIGEIDGLQVTRTLTVDADTYLIREKTKVSSDTPRSARLAYAVAGTFPAEHSYNAPRVAWLDNGSYDDENSESTLREEGIIRQGTLAWSGIMNNYFMNTVAPLNASSATLRARIQNNAWRSSIEIPEKTVEADSPAFSEVCWWFGPKDRSLLAKTPGDLAAAVHYGFFSIIAAPLLLALDFFYSLVKNWGIAILILTLCIRACFWPLSQKSFRSMEQMKKLQPMMQKLRDKYGNDKEALNREMLQLYRTYKVNPMSGCLPILIQIPVFIGLYQALLNSIELRHASFIDKLPFTDLPWLADLSAADPFYITPILMGGTMFLQQWLAPAAGDATQQKIMMFMPLIFTVMFLNFPSGLVIYWLFNNLLSILQQWMLHRKAN